MYMPKIQPMPNPEAQDQRNNGLCVGCTVVEDLTHNPKIKGSNPAKHSQLSFTIERL